VSIDNANRPTVLAVDDTPANLSLLANLLKDQYRVKIANHGQKGLDLALAAPPDLILLDIMMPELDGYEVCRRLKADPRTARIPVIFLTAKTEIADEELGFAVGAVDFIHKPISPPIVAARVHTHLQIKQWQDFLQDQNAWLQQEVERRLSEVNHLQDASIQVMVSLAEFRDECTGNHIRRTQAYVRLLATRLADEGRHSRLLTGNYIELLAKSAPLHDIGKIAIPDHILLKPGKLSDEEFAVMKTHTARGYDMLKKAGEQMGERGDFLSMAMEIAGYHHEKWDGSGYPHRLAGEAIPLSARLMAVADVYDALRTRRPYKEPMSHAAALDILRQGAGSHFDPELIEAFAAVEQEVLTIAEHWADVE
jgi:putative two-component system response regulator